MACTDECISKKEYRKFEEGLDNNKVKLATYWECTAYSSSRASFTEKLQEPLGDSYAHFDLLSNVEKTVTLGREQWEKNFISLLFLVICEVRKQILYGDDACPSHLQSQSSVGDLGGTTGVDGQRIGKLDKRDDVNMHFGVNS